MTDVFVWSGATGANNGTSWEDAFITLIKDWGATITPGVDQVYVRSIHSEIGPVATGKIFGSTAEFATVNVDIRSVVGAATGTTPGALAKGAEIVTQSGRNMQVSEGLYMNGVTFDLTASLIGFGEEGQGDTAMVLEDCEIKLDATQFINIGSGASGAAEITFINMDIEFTGSNGGIRQNFDAVFRWIGGRVTAGTNTHLFVSPANNGGFGALVANVDFSVLTKNLLDGGNLLAECRYVFSRCLLGPGLGLMTGDIRVPFASAEFIHCHPATDPDPSFQYAKFTQEGLVEADPATYREGGASDGVRTNPISRKMDVGTGSKRTYPGHALESPSMPGWTTAGAHIYRLYIASNFEQLNNAIWAEITLPNDAATNSLGVVKSSRVAPETTPTSYPLDVVSSWVGPDRSVIQIIDFSHTPAKEGPFSAKFFMVSDGGIDDYAHVDVLVEIDP